MALDEFGRIEQNSTWQERYVANLDERIQAYRAAFSISYDNEATRYDAAATILTEIRNAFAAANGLPLSRR